MKKIIVVMTLALTTSSAYGVPATIFSTPTKQTDNKVFAGFSWTIGGSAIPQLAIGFRSAKVSSNGDVYGNSLSMNIRLDKPSAGKLKLNYFNGTQTVQGEAGLGYDFSNSQFLFGAGLHGPYLNGGLDYLLGGKFDPYLGIDSIGKYKKPNESCPAPFTPANGRCLFNAPPV